MRGGGARQAAAAEDAEQTSPQQLDRMPDEQLARMLMLLLEREVRSLLLACRESLCIPAMTLSKRRCEGGLPAWMCGAQHTC